MAKDGGARRSITDWQRPATDQELRFASEFTLDLDPEGAALRAGYDPAVARMAQSTLLKEPQIESAIAALMVARGLRTNVTYDRVVMEMSRLALSDPLDCFDVGTDDEGNRTIAVKPIDQIPEDTRRAIESIEVSVGGAMKIKFAPKLPALNALLPHIHRETKRGRSSSVSDQDRLKALGDLAMRLQQRTKKSLPSTVRAETVDSRGRVVSVEISTDGEEKDVTP